MVRNICAILHRMGSDSQLLFRVHMDHSIKEQPADIGLDQNHLRSVHVRLPFPGTIAFIVPKLDRGTHAGPYRTEPKQTANLPQHIANIQSFRLAKTSAAG